MKKIALLALLAVTPTAFACPPAASQQAQKYKDAIGKATLPSESDYTWKTFCSKQTVANFSKAEVRAAVGAHASDTIEIRTHKDVMAMLDQFATDEDMLNDAERQAYATLKGLLLSDFSELRVIRVIEEENSAEVKVFLVGRDAEGRLIGLRSISIET